MPLIRRTLKPVAGSLIGAFWGATKVITLQGALSVFVYHDVSNNPSEFSRMYNLNVKPDIFDYQLNFIKKNFNIISPNELLSNRVPPKAALITFDDGMRSFFVNAIPILGKYGIPAIIFLNMGPIKGEVFWSGLITYLCNKRYDFVEHCAENKVLAKGNMPLYLFCTKEIVELYLRKKQGSFENEVSDFVGEFAAEEDLERAAEKGNIFFGNHLFNHHVPLLMSDEDLLESFSKNANELKKYRNYRDMFSFPFGQPGTCFSEKQASMILSNGAKRVFSSDGAINYDSASSYLHRISLSSFNDSDSKIWFQIFRKSVGRKTMESKTK